jgi:hypothetical protein
LPAAERYANPPENGVANVTEARWGQRKRKRDRSDEDADGSSKDRWDEDADGSSKDRWHEDGYGSRKDRWHEDGNGSKDRWHEDADGRGRSKDRWDEDAGSSSKGRSEAATRFAAGHSKALEALEVASGKGGKRQKSRKGKGGKGAKAEERKGKGGKGGKGGSDNRGEEVEVLERKAKTTIAAKRSSTRPSAPLLSRDTNLLEGLGPGQWVYVLDDETVVKTDLLEEYNDLQEYWERKEGIKDRLMGPKEWHEEDLEGDISTEYWTRQEEEEEEEESLHGFSRQFVPFKNQGDRWGDRWGD